MTIITPMIMGAIKASVIKPSIKLGYAEIMVNALHKTKFFLKLYSWILWSIWNILSLCLTVVLNGLLDVWIFAS